MAAKSLADGLRRSFTDRDLAAGKQYFLDGRVRVTRIDDFGAEFEVQGSEPEPYELRLQWALADVVSVEGWCNCPRWAEVGVCKHQFAALLAADSTGHVPAAILAGLNAKSRLRESVDEAHGDDDEEVADDDIPFGGREEAEWRRLNQLGPLSILGSSFARKGREPAWRERLEELGKKIAKLAPRSDDVTKLREAWFVVDAPLCVEHDRIVLSLYQREQRQTGRPGELKKLHVTPSEIEAWPDPTDRELLRQLIGGSTGSLSAYGLGFRRDATISEVIPLSSVFHGAFRRAVDRGRVLLRTNPGAPPRQADRLRFDDGPPYELRLTPTLDKKKTAWRLKAELVRTVGGDRQETLALDKLVFALSDGTLCVDSTISRLARASDAAWLAMFRDGVGLTCPANEFDAFLKVAASLAGLPRLELPPACGWSVEAGEPRPMVRFVRRHYDEKRHAAMVSFLYGDFSVDARAPDACIVDEEAKRLVRRDTDAEQGFLAQLPPLNVRPPKHFEDGAGTLPTTGLTVAAETLCAAGWRIEIDGRPVRAAKFQWRVSSGIDWFDVSGGVQFDDQVVELPELLKAVRGGKSWIVLADGSQGTLPTAMLRRLETLASLGNDEAGGLRFRRDQGMLLDMLLAEQDEIRSDRAFNDYRAKLHDFTGITPADAPPTFQGSLRPYQQYGVGWFEFLREFGFGGCLADDMGLGKTVQLLAMLERRRASRKKSDKGPTTSVIVVPRSLVHNWLDEAARFTPQLKVASFYGSGRGKTLPDVDVVITTYGMIRQSIDVFRKFEFDYAVLDEAQAIKNVDSLASKAVRLLKARHRLALSGTPVENRIAELWSLMDFINPGLVGRLPKLRAVGPATAEAISEMSTAVARALRPLILRRTKEQVLPELPEKVEQTLRCDLEAPQRKLYDELRDHYRGLLEKKIAADGLGKSKIVALEALLRLRQAACHPGLLDNKKVSEPSAKLDCLLEQLEEVVAEGHKALVFSQFTSLLAIVKSRLDELGLKYEYLDGKTRNRQAPIERFQNDPGVGAFLISLKAGGTGLNLTAADYVFILDPWWNPAVEAQAVDRAHRMGQQRKVFAYRLIAAGTVEEKILALQADKRRLADAIITEDNSLVADLTAEDLRMLLS
jgi:superfamily II DNA or RNA helicase